jgi:NADH dehydrogenase
MPLAGALLFKLEEWTTVDQVQTSSGPPRIVIVGGGFGGAYCAQKLERLLRPGEAEVVLLDRNNYFVFYPLLVEAGTGSLEPRHAVVSIRSFLDRTRFVMADVVTVDRDRREVAASLPEGRQGLRLAYDHLVLTPGSVTRLPEIPGLQEHGFEIKSLADAVELRDHAIRQLERADAIDDPEVRHQLLHFVVVGANFTGVEVAGEFQVFLQRARRRYTNIHRDDITVTLVEIGPRILPALDSDLAEYATERMVRRGIVVRLDTSVRSVEADRVVLSDGSRVATETVIWCAGIAPSPLVGRLSVPVDDRGYILCDRELRVQGSDHVWAIGDSAVNLGPEGRPYPATAQHAVQQGLHLARNLVRVLRARTPLPCDIRSKGELAALGCRTGVAKVFGVKLSGFPAWFLWRTVYLMKMPGLARRLRVALDWTMDLLFPKDIVQLGLREAALPGHETPAQSIGLESAGPEYPRDAEAARGGG